MSEYLHLIIEAGFIYIFLAAGLRWMGKKEFGQINVFDVVVFLMIAQVLSISLTEDDMSIFHGLVASITLMGIDVLFSYITLKSKRMRDFIEGTPTYIIKNGEVNYEKMRKCRYNFDDLILQMRELQISSISEIEFAILETNGSLSVLTKKNCKVRYPEPVILEGVIIHKSLEEMGVSEEWLLNQLKEQGYNQYEDILFCLVEKKQLFVIKK